QQDLVILLTPHIVRTHELTETDLKPIYIGSQQNLGIGGPPPLIAPQAEAAPAPAVPAVAPAGAPAAAPPAAPGAASTNQQLRGASGTIATPPGSSPVPGTVLVAPPAGQPAPLPPAEPVPPTPAAPPPAPPQPLPVETPPAT